AKDRHGTYQRVHLVAHVAVNNVAQGVEVLIQAPEERLLQTFYMEQVSRFLENIPCASGRGVPRGVHGKTETTRLALESLVAEGIEVLIQAPEERFRPTFYMEQVSRFLEDIPCASGRGVQRGVQGKTDTIRLALECLVEEGYVAKEATKSGHQYRSLRAFREDDPVENLTAPPAPPRAPDDRGAAPRPPAPHRAPMDWGAVSGDLESDRAPRAPDPPLTGGPAGARSEATAADGREPNERDRAPAHESGDDLEEWF